MAWTGGSLRIEDFQTTTSALLKYGNEQVSYCTTQGRSRFDCYMPVLTSGGSYGGEYARKLLPVPLSASSASGNDGSMKKTFLQSGQFASLREASHFVTHFRQYECLQLQGRVTGSTVSASSP
ncbi:hypothetical protein AC579_9290 [Pseudocercospora musae]|uniref:Uncharacterized protein n=1 Tax=Pseudocercospora musae TaxID=113226 RepID=A0A139I500_9PEZI|nr:hypothetical protein AC579_9290 [Pseudocercospora musae]KXT09843.1 hypothetical protein AC579_9290 [Pseudocercospora musae]